ncbi:CubicO group peptidase, beta-lactamase class C family [Paenibacillus uliginis N3/975]|uniref:CubicO group peptidase, beta-lactamase class C family n=1 Tax=Paenibacillus uliginis N3/975 TaxID=1313296 RepID=A0A1X7H6R1_9BACL|nr:serine hydrolase domain-containing protein [Paenibacillus uliginis]SMF80311.1 CubicO group peptidase, beta-lactamase class C family [Paenibacillus uliginis N3/975]
MTEQLAHIVDTYHKEHFLSGNILITRSGKELFSRSYGQASIQLGIPNQPDTKFHIASVTKMFIAAATLHYCEQGLINLEEHPGKYLDGFTILHPDIRIHHLLSHSSGLQDIYRVPDIRYEMNRLTHENKSFLDYLCSMNQDFQPGERWSYNSTGFIMLGYILEAVSGKPYEQAFEELFFTPLHMKSTRVDNPMSINVGRAYGHTSENNELMHAHNDKLCGIDAPGEFYSTTRDLDIWCDALFQGKLLSRSSLETMFTPYYITTFDPDLHYGYGWFLGSDFNLIGGGTPGFRSEIWHYPGLDTRIIMLWNYEKVDSHRLFHQIKPLVLQL